MRKEIRWLHISDIHFRGKNQIDQGDAFRRLSDDISARIAGGKALDLIFVTGDIVHSGQAPDYVKVAAHLSQLCAVAKLPPSRVLFCPGNHDSDNGVAPVLMRGCWSTFQDLSKFEAFLATDEFEPLKARQKAYRDFITRFRGDACGFDSHHLHAVLHIPLDDVRVSILSVNSCMLAEGGKEDVGRLQVALRVLEARCKELGEGDICFALIHHPFEWLVPFEADRAEAAIFDTADIVLRGHLHRPKVGLSLRGGIASAAGALWEEAAGDYEYGHGVLSIDSLSCDVETTRFVQQTGKWMTTTESAFFERERITSCSPGIVAARLPRTFAFPEQIAAVLTGHTTEMMMILSGTPNYVRGEMVIAAGLSVAPPPAALGVLKVATMIRFYGLPKLDAILASELAALAAYDSELLHAAGADPEFADLARAKESASVRLSRALPSETVWTARLLARLVAERNMDAISALQEHTGGPLLARLRASIAAGSRDPYESWLAIGAPPLDRSELVAIATRLAERSTADLAVRALTDATIRFPAEVAGLRELARLVATAAEDPSVYSNFRAAAEAP